MMLTIRLFDNLIITVKNNNNDIIDTVLFNNDDNNNNNNNNISMVRYLIPPTIKFFQLLPWLYKT